MELRSTLMFALSLLSLSSVVISDPNCMYTIFVKTGTVSGAGTNSKISLLLSDSTGNYINIENLETWGDMEAGHDYFEKGNLDVFRENAECLPEPICWMQLTSDGSGYKPGWFVDYVEVFITGSSSSSHEKFLLNRWLALSEPPYTLQAIVDHCNGIENGHILRHQVNTISSNEIGRISSVI